MYVLLAQEHSVDRSSTVHLAASMGKRKQESKEETDATLAAMHAAAGTSVKGLCRMLKVLAEKDMLRDDMATVCSTTDRALEQVVISACQKAAETDTPFGTVVQHMDLGADGYRQWPYIHPLALLWFLSLRSPEFGLLMQSILDNCSKKSLDIVIYDDAFQIGNPLRPDMGRNMLGVFFDMVNPGAVTVPWLEIGGILLLAYVFSLVTTILPAIQASRIYPAEALRYE